MCEFEKKFKIKDTITFGTLPLKFEGIEKYQDTIELHFYFYYKESIRCDNILLRNMVINNGAGYKIGSDRILYYSRPSTFNRYFITGDGESRYINPLQPAVIEYITRNKDKLAPWFRDEAIRRKIIPTL